MEDDERFARLYVAWHQAKLAYDWCKIKWVTRFDENCVGWTRLHDAMVAYLERLESELGKYFPSGHFPK